ncbi:MAG TPA: hypothetical protein VHZ50_13065, partial [Puia sp.]|nr:hypothetical protein [Puia sp.]
MKPNKLYPLQVFLLTLLLVNPIVLEMYYVLGMNETFDFLIMGIAIIPGFVLGLPILAIVYVLFF